MARKNNDKKLMQTSKMTNFHGTPHNASFYESYGT